MHKYVNSMDILLAPYQKEISVAGGGKLSYEWISPLKIFEYMSSGKAIMTSDLPALREVLKHKYSAILCRSNDTDDWANSLKSLNDDESKRKEIGANARKEFLSKYTWGSRAKKILDSINL